jgi:uncharacterized protein
MSLEVRRFGRATREMVGLLLRPSNAAARRPAFLFCRPFGQEATRTASMYRVLADRLAREGTPVLAFDYHGTGDSPGEEGDQTLRGWTEDIEAAHALLQDEAGGPVHWFAMGLACQMALRAAARIEQPPAHLVLWEPVFDGKTYLDAMFAAHRDELAYEYQQTWAQLIRQGRATEPAVPGDVLGFELGQALVDEIRLLQHLPLAPAFAACTPNMSSGSRPCPAATAWRCDASTAARTGCSARR